MDYAERVLPSITNEVLKAVVAQFDTGEMITQREIVSKKVSLALAERAAQFGLMLDDIPIDGLVAPKGLDQAMDAEEASRDANRKKVGAPEKQGSRR